jgi:hypothetical protein
VQRCEPGVVAHPLGSCRRYLRGPRERRAEPVAATGCLRRDGSNCLAQARLVWQQIIDAAEANYDRTSACTFTSFIAYEYTAMAASGRCNDDLLPCWDQMGTGHAVGRLPRLR